MYKIDDNEVQKSFIVRFTALLLPVYNIHGNRFEDLLYNEISKVIVDQALYIVNCGTTDFFALFTGRRLDALLYDLAAILVFSYLTEPF